MKSEKPKIGFGLKKPDREIIKSLIRSKKYAGIILVGPNAIRNVNDFKKIISPCPEETLPAMLVHGAFDGIVRGTIDDLKTFEAYEKLVGKEKTKNMFQLGMLEDFYGRKFFISQPSNPAGWSREEKISDCEGLIGFMKKTMGVKPKIGLLTGVRHETYARRKKTLTGVQGILNKTYEDAEFIAGYFRKKRIAAKNYAIELETALAEGCNIIVPPNGMVGNQIFRALVFIGGGKLLTATRVNLPHFYEDNSRSETDFEPHFKWIVSLIKKKATL